MTTDDLSPVFAALADPTRRSILNRLAAGPLTSGELAAQYAMSRPAVSQHLGVLEAAGLIDRVKDGARRECRLRGERLDAAGDWITAARAEWSERFDRLDEHLRARRATLENDRDGAAPAARERKP
jgi:DNA-binding transcriptional ArsR family regulator